MPECKCSFSEVGVEEATQDPHPLVAKGALIGVTAGAAVGAIGM